MLFILYLFPLYSQEKSAPYKYWMTFELYGSNNNISLGAAYSFSAGEYFYKAGYFTRSAFSLWDKMIVDNTGHYYKCINICIGKRYQFEWFQAAFFAGPAYVFGEKEVKNSIYKNYNTAGLQTDIQLLFRIADEIGIGAGLYCNLNFEQPYAGININLAFGNGK